MPLACDTTRVDHLPSTDGLIGIQWSFTLTVLILKSSFYVESAIDNRTPSNIGRACVTTKEAKRNIITASER